MGIKEICVLVGVLCVGYWLGTNDVFSRFLPGA